MDLPEGSQRMYKGEIFSVYEWPQKLFDGSVKTFEKIVRVPSVEAILVHEGKLVVLDQEQPGRSLYPSLPAGRVEENEHPDDAMKRELLEELGCTADLEKFQEYFGYSKLYFPEYIYIGRYVQFVQDPQLDPGERISWRLVEFDDFLQLCRNKRFSIAHELKMYLYECLVDEQTRSTFHAQLFR